MHLHSATSRFTITGKSDTTLRGGKNVVPRHETAANFVQGILRA